MNPNSKPNPTPGNRKVFLNLVYLVVTIVFLILVFVFADGFNTQNSQKNTFSDLVTEIRNKNVSEIIVSEDKKTITAKIYKDKDNKKRDSTEDKNYPAISTDKNVSPLESLKSSLKDDELQIGTGEGQVMYTETPKSFLTQLVENSVFQFFIQLLIIGAIAIFIIRRLGDVNSKSISFGNSRAKSYDDLDNKDKVTFADVAGNEEAKLELTEVVDFLKRPKEYLKMGARIPRGVLLVGKPGNGKTLMARAVAGEAEVPFLFVSGSEFVEMFVGVGAGRVRDLFKQAKKKAPCVIFIDEIDAVGRQRGSGLGNGNDEREQTLNQILVEMDGFEPTSSVIVIGATNRLDVLDPALLRPGRFDRQVTVTSPDKAERELILKVHAKNKKIAKDIDFSVIARRTPGFSGADLMNVLNEGAILAVREGKNEIDNEILREAIEKVMLGPSLKSKVITPEQKKLTAYHEAGHAIVQTVLPKADKVQKVTIIPRGRAAGYTYSDQGENDKMGLTKTEFEHQITALFGGYTVEKMIFDEISTGASNDLARATEIARSMVMKYGMSSFGPISFDSDRGLRYMGKDMMEEKVYSEDTGRRIDVEVKSILDSCFEKCQEIIKKYRTELEALANKLIEEEVIEFEEFKELTKEIANPGYSS